MKRGKNPGKAGKKLYTAQRHGFFCHRAYSLKPWNNGWRGTHTLWRLFPCLPQAFDWPDRDDVDGLRTYIDDLYRGDVKVTERLEKTGQVQHVIMPDRSQFQPMETIKVNVRHLLDVLQLVDHIEVPLWSRLSFLTSGQRCVPRDYIAALAGAFPDRFGDLDPEQDWVPLTDVLMKREGIDPRSITSGMNRPPPATAAAPDAYQAPPAPPAERTLIRLDQGGYIDWTTEVRGEQGVFYARRLYRGTHLFYEATAWSINGPWRVTQRDSAALLALGVTL